MINKLFTKLNNFFESDFYRTFINPPEFSELERKQFYEFSADDYKFIVTIFTSALIVITFISLPIDYLIYERSPALISQFLKIKIAGISGALLTILLVNKLSAKKVKTSRYMATGVLMTFTTLSYFLAQMGDPYSLWFHPNYILPAILAVEFRWDFVERTFWLVLALAGLLAPFFILHPESLFSEKISVLGFLLVFANTINLMGSHLISNLYKDSFRTNDLLKEERERSEELLLNVLPEDVADRLKNTDEMIADGYDKATVIFADIVDFTSLAGELSPDSIVMLLDDIMSAFDDLVADYPVEKIKTVGDEYFITSGVPQEIENHAVVAGELAIEMRNVVQKYKRSADEHFDVRVGLNTGPVVAGVIGTDKFVYDVWGDTVNVGSRMETQGEPGKIQVTPATKRAIEKRDDDRFNFEKRGKIEVKGKEKMTTYYLHQKGEV